MIDMSYRGITIGRGLPMARVGPSTAHVACKDPMPVGTELLLQIDEERGILAEVIRVVEAEAEMPRGVWIQVDLDLDTADWWEARVDSEEMVVPEPLPESVSEGGGADAQTSGEDDSAHDESSDGARVHGQTADAAAGQASGDGADQAETVALPPKRAATQTMGYPTAELITPMPPEGEAADDDAATTTEWRTSDMKGNTSTRVTDEMAPDEIRAVMDQGQGDAAAAGDDASGHSRAGRATEIMHPSEIAEVIASTGDGGPDYADIVARATDGGDDGSATGEDDDGDGDADSDDK